MKKKSVLSLLLAAALALFPLPDVSCRGSWAKRSLSSTATEPSRKRKTA